MFKELMMARTARVAMAVIAIAGMSACANFGKNATPEDKVSARSNNLLELRMNNKFKEAYAYTSPGYRAINSYDKFRLKYGVAFPLNGGKLASVACEESRCKLTRAFTTFTPLIPKGEIPIGIEEIWIYQDGQWWWHIQ